MFKTTSTLPSNIFAKPEASPNSFADGVPQRREIMALVDAAAAAGGPFAAFKLRRAGRAENAELIAETLRAYFASQREMLVFRTQLALDEAKKRAIADKLGSTAQIELEISRMTSQVVVSLMGQVDDIFEAAAHDAASRIARLTTALQEKRITERNHASAVMALEARADEIRDKAQAVADRVTENLGERLAAALKHYAVNPS